MFTVFLLFITETSLLFRLLFDLRNYLLLLYNSVITAIQSFMQHTINIIIKNLFHYVNFES